MPRGWPSGCGELWAPCGPGQLAGRCREADHQVVLSCEHHVGLVSLLDAERLTIRLWWAVSTMWARLINNSCVLITPTVITVLPTNRWNPLNKMWKVTRNIWWNIHWYSEKFHGPITKKVNFQLFSFSKEAVINYSEGCLSAWSTGTFVPTPLSQPCENLWPTPELCKNGNSWLFPKKIKNPVPLSLSLHAFDFTVFPPIFSMTFCEF